MDNFRVSIFLVCVCSFFPHFELLSFFQSLVRRIPLYLQSYQNYATFFHSSGIIIGRCLCSEVKDEEPSLALSLRRREFQIKKDNTS